MSKMKNNKELMEQVKKADLVFSLSFKDNTQHLTIADGVAVADILTVPFRISLHLKDLIDQSVNEGQTGQAVEETPQTKN